MTDSSELAIYRVVEIDYGANSRHTKWIRATSKTAAENYVRTKSYRPGIIDAVELTPPGDVEVINAE